MKSMKMTPNQTIAIQLEASEAKEPVVTSTDPNERKLARRLRIQRRNEILQRQNDNTEEEIVEQSATEKQIITSAELLDELITEADEVVSCVRVANDAREIHRRNEERETRKRMMEKLEKEDAECSENYRAIAVKWAEIAKYKDPLDIHSDMAVQNEKCLEVLAKKDSLIAELRHEVELADKAYEEDQRKQAEDVDLLIDRIEKQVEIMKGAYKRELALIDSAMESERKLALKISDEKWKELFEKLKTIGRDGIEKRKEIMREYERDLEKAMIEHQEELRSERTRLGNEVGNLQQEVERTKALCLFNKEKLDYNYAILKAREEENAIIRNYQRKRINKLEETLNNLKKEYNELEQNTRAEIHKYADQILKTHKSIKEIEEKSNYFTNANEKRYFEIWNMNVRTADELLNKILAIDKIIYEEILHLKWKPPDMDLLSLECLPSYKNATSNRKDNEDNNKSGNKIGIKKSCTSEEMNSERRLLNHIMKQISDNADYLFEEDLERFIKPYTANDQTVSRLENIFEVLKLSTEEDITLLLKFFLPYTYCPTCENENMDRDSKKSSDFTLNTSSEESDVCGISSSDSKLELTSREIKLIDAMKYEIRLREESKAPSTSSSTSTDEKISQQDEICLCSTTGVTDENVEKRYQCEQGHALEIHGSKITKALKEFTAQHLENMKKDASKALSDGHRLATPANSRKLNVEDVTKFWQRYRDIFSPEKEKLWGALIIGMQKYYEILKKRHEHIAEIESLKQQNAELQRLLKVHTTQLNDNSSMSSESSSGYNTACNDE